MTARRRRRQDRRADRRAGGATPADRSYPSVRPGWAAGVVRDRRPDPPARPGPARPSARRRRAAPSVVRRAGARWSGSARLRLRPGRVPADASPASTVPRPAPPARGGSRRRPVAGGQRAAAAGRRRRAVRVRPWRRGRRRGAVSRRRARVAPPAGQPRGLAGRGELGGEGGGAEGDGVLGVRVDQGGPVERLGDHLRDQRDAGGAADQQDGVERRRARPGPSAGCGSARRWWTRSGRGSCPRTRCGSARTSKCRLRQEHRDGGLGVDRQGLLGQRCSPGAAGPARRRSAGRSGPARTAPRRRCS